MFGKLLKVCALGFFWTMLRHFVLLEDDIVFNVNLKVFTIWKSIWFSLTVVGCCHANYDLEAVKNVHIVLFCGPFSVI